jgi:hypothetical protein
MGGKLQPWVSNQSWTHTLCNSRINAGAFRVPWEETVAVLDEIDFGMTVYEIAP